MFVTGEATIGKALVSIQATLYVSKAQLWAQLSS